MDNLEVRIARLEDDVRKLSKVTIRNNYDVCLDEYLKDESIVNFLGRSTVECYGAYCSYRSELGEHPASRATIRLFNKAIKQKFNTLTVRHVTRNSRNTYLWVDMGKECEF